MADKKISELVNLTSLATDDEFVVVDADANATKRITVANLVNFPSQPTVSGDDVYHQGNILGTVSESGGTPTGAILERGSNANGEFVKFADGTMICSHRDIDGVTSTTDITLPATFVNAEHVVLPSHQQPADRILGTNRGEQTASTFRLRPQDASASFVTVNNVEYVAFGRWF